MTQRLELGGVVVYAVLIACFVYGVAEQQRTYGNDALTAAAFAALALLHLAAGFAIGRWWALLLIPLAILIALPAGYPNDLRGEPWPIWTTFVLAAPVEAGLIAAGVALRKLGRRQRVKTRPLGAH